MALVVLVVLGSLSWEYHHYLEELVHQLNIELFFSLLGIVIVGSSFTCIGGDGYCVDLSSCCLSGLYLGRSSILEEYNGIIVSNVNLLEETLSLIIAWWSGVS